MTKWVFLILIFGLMVGCSRSAQVTKDELQNLSNKWKEPKVAIWYYQGTDENYHYFKYMDLGINNKYKVEKTEMKLKINFPFTNEQKKWYVMPWGPNANKKE